MSVAAITDPLSGRSLPIPSWTLVGGVTLLIGLVFLTDEHRWDRSGLTDYVESAEERAGAATEGNKMRRVAFAVLGLSGFLLLIGSGQYPALREPMGLFLILATCWTFASFLWADSVAFTLKRLALLVLCSSGILGLASVLSLQKLARVALLVTTFYLLIGVLAELSLGNFRPWAGGYRFAGTLHPNAQATNCGAMALSAFAVWRRPPEGTDTRSGIPGGRQFVGTLFLTALFFLLLTKSRTAAAANIFVIGLVWATKRRLGTNLIVLGVGIMAALTLACSLMVTGATADLTESANLGRADSQGAFNGRLPIWEICIRRVGTKLPIGFGYDGFWTPERIEDVSWELGWSISSAHSEYIEIALGLGIIGLGLYLTVQTLGIGWFWLRYFRLGYGGDAMIFGLLLIGAIQGFMETSYLHPSSFAPFICLTGMTRLAFFSNHDTMWKGVV